MVVLVCILASTGIVGFLVSMYFHFAALEATTKDVGSSNALLRRSRKGAWWFSVKLMDMLLGAIDNHLFVWIGLVFVLGVGIRWGGDLREFLGSASAEGRQVLLAIAALVSVLLLTLLANIVAFRLHQEKYKKRLEELQDRLMSLQKGTPPARASDGSEDVAGKTGGEEKQTSP